MKSWNNYRFWSKITVGIILILIIGSGGYYLYSEHSQFGYEKYIPDEAEGYKNYIQRIKKGEITSETLFDEFIPLLPKTEDDMTLKDHQAITAVTLTGIEEFKEELLQLTENERLGFCEWIQFLPMVAQGTEKFDEEEKSKELIYLREKSKEQLENMVNEIGRKCGESNVTSVLQDFYVMVSELYDDLTPETYRAYMQQAMELKPKMRQAIQDKIAQAKQELEELRENEINGHKLKQTERYFQYIKESAKIIEERFREIETNIEKSGLL